jgi:hypothetical protein
LTTGLPSYFWYCARRLGGCVAARSRIMHGV